VWRSLPIYGNSSHVWENPHISEVFPYIGGLPIYRETSHVCEFFPYMGSFPCMGKVPIYGMIIPTCIKLLKPSFACEIVTVAQNEQSQCTAEEGKTWFSFN
jgi:hypothetical protein